MHGGFSPSTVVYADDPSKTKRNAVCVCRDFWLFPPVGLIAFQRRTISYHKVPNNPGFSRIASFRLLCANYISASKTSFLISSYFQIFGMVDFQFGSTNSLLPKRVKDFFNLFKNSCGNFRRIFFRHSYAPITYLVYPRPVVPFNWALRLKV